MKATTKVAAVATGLALAASMLALAPIAHAAFPYSNDLTVGSMGMEVTTLQQGLIANGYSIPAGATGYFGSQTQAAVSAWQAAMGISPTAGYFGPISRAAWNFSGGSSGGSTSTVPGCAPGALFSSTTGQSCASTAIAGCGPGALFSSTTGQACGTTGTPTAGLSGSFGTIDAVTKLGQYDNEQVSEGNSGVKVLGVEIEASNDGDIGLQSIRLTFDATGNTGSTRLNRYLDSVSIMLDGDEIGSVDVDDFTRDSSNSNLWTKTIPLTGAVIRADQKQKLYVEVDAQNNIDSADITGDSWTVAIDNIRFIDGSGVTTTDTTTGYIGDAGTAISFVSFSTSADTVLKVSRASDSPQAGIVVVSSTADTNNVSLLKGSLKLDGTSDVVLDQFPVTFTVVSGGTANGVDDVTGSVSLKIGGQTFTETMTITGALVGTVTFDNLDLDIDAGDTVSFEVLADINDLDGTIFVAGDTLKADVTSTNRDYMDVENSQGDQLSDSTDKSGTATGEAQEFRVNGIMLTLVSQSAVSNNNSNAADVGTFKIKYKVTAVGDTVYVSSLATSVGLTYAVDRSGTATTATSITGTLSATAGSGSYNTLTSVGNYQINEDDSTTFELTVTVPNGAGGAADQYRNALTGVKWDTDDDATPDNNYTSNLQNFKTDYVFLDAA